MKVDAILTFVSFFASFSGVVFAYLAFKRSKEQDSKLSGKNEGVMFSDIGYIKCYITTKKRPHLFAVCSLTSAASKRRKRNRSIAERLAKVEESVANVTKRVDEIYKSDIP